MPKPAGDTITHCNSARTRLYGSGNLIGIVGDSAGNLEQMANAIIPANTTRSVTQLCSFTGEHLFFEIRVTEIDEWFHVDSMYSYIKPTAASYPQALSTG